MVLQAKTFILTFSEPITIGDLKCELLAQVCGDKKDYDIDFMDVDNIIYRDVPIIGYKNWSKFRNFHKEMGIDFDEILRKHFNEIFTKEALEPFINKINL
jgi:hypothetical protein